MMRLPLFALLLSLMLGCAQRPPVDDSLYQELGQKPGIQRVVEGMLLNAAADPRIFRRFVNIDIVPLRDKLIEQICVASGGPCEPSGDSRQETRQRLELSAAEFDALVEDLQKAMDAQGLPATTQKRLLARLAPMRELIIRR